MTSHKTRMADEFKQLDERIEKLGNFLIAHNSKKLDFDLSCPVDLLIKQLSIMMAYREVLTQRLNEASCKVYQQALQEQNQEYYQQNVGLDDLLSAAQMRVHFEKGIDSVMARAPYVDKLAEAHKKIQIATGWRVEGTLREFAKFKPVNMWFSYPVHEVDKAGVLADIQLEDNSHSKAAKARSGWKSKEQKADERKQKLETAYSALFDGSTPVTVKEIQEYLDIESDRTIRNYIKQHDGFDVKKGIIFKVNLETEK